MAIIAITLLALFLWITFRSELKEQTMLSRGVARNNGWKKRTKSTITCQTCRNEIETAEESAYCEHCRQYI
ncbi:hypothetical protein SAMN04488053_104204 [Alkalicoccus daliensis]|uniref:Uncharacterized protein n=2 Tax=Alkalicoccus daliensis TaxID=745820 RepID=A0A1H0F681_9BACI|nr:hypothetical protein SAMN04488053_104204 [Alkalicoccus daliensis]